MANRKGISWWVVVISSNGIFNRIHAEHRFCVLIATWSRFMYRNCFNLHTKMYASNLIRVFCNRGFVLSRPLISSHHQSLASNNFVSIVNNPNRFEIGLKNKSLTSVLFSTSSSPDDNHIVSKGKTQKKRLRIISSSSSEENENPSPRKTAENAKWVNFLLFFMSMF